MTCLNTKLASQVDANWARKFLYHRSSLKLNYSKQTFLVCIRKRLAHAQHKKPVKNWLPWFKSPTFFLQISLQMSCAFARAHESSKEYHHFTFHLCFSPWCGSFSV